MEETTYSLSSLFYRKKYETGRTLIPPVTSVKSITMFDDFVWVCDDHTATFTLTVPSVVRRKVLSSI